MIKMVLLLKKMLLEELGLLQMENLDRKLQKSKDFLPLKEEEEEDY